MSDRQKYTVGWICAIHTENVAATVFLDKEHEKPDVPPNDNNAYTVGEIWKHNVVIAVLPAGEYGTASAASVARDMVHAFPNIRIGLMVGIGGGVPTKRDIRLGDVVVSYPQDGYSGVFQYDFGKTHQDKKFQCTGFLDQPPAVLRAALSTLRSRYEIYGHHIEKDIEGVFEKVPRLRKNYSRPESSSDRLFNSEVLHEVACTTCCSEDVAKLRWRPERTEEEDNPAIHYGLIASGNQLMKDAMIRDKLAEEKGVLCFEMEAAGLMNHFPCLVIRGICDYSDSHKNKQWQGYAAMVAAAYAKDLLRQIHPNDVGKEQKITDVLPGIYEVLKDHRATSNKLLQNCEDFARKRLSNEQQRCRQLFRLTRSDRDITYEQYKDQVKERVDGTCMWFLDHPNFQTWLKEESGPLLVSADPGCGKSVLAKYLVDHALPRSATICYFFFKAEDQNTIRQALCALLHQLFSQKPQLTKHAMTQYQKNGDGLINSTISLWNIFENATKDPQAGLVIAVLDALDECLEPELRNLIENVKRQCTGDRIIEGQLKYLLTCRPYENIVSGFQDLRNAFPYIHIPGEDESKAISQEVNHVIRHRVKGLSPRLPPEAVTYLEKRLQEGTHRTYLWVYLVFDYLETQNYKRTLTAIKAAIGQLPNSVNEAYDKILSKSGDDGIVLKVLSIILAASRPLTVSEINVALNVEQTLQSLQDLDLEPEKQFTTRLRSQCGLFISIYDNKIHFLHQTAREFLIAKASIGEVTEHGPKLRWQESITTQKAHYVLAELCVLYLKLFNMNDTEDPYGCSPSGLSERKCHRTNHTAFLDYSALFWSVHFREADIHENEAIIWALMEICNPNTKCYPEWFNIYSKSTRGVVPSRLHGVVMASYYGFCGVLRKLLDEGADINERDSEHHMPLLSWAIENRHEGVVKLLLSYKTIELNAEDKYSSTPLMLAVEKAHEPIVKLMLAEERVDLNKVSTIGQTPLSFAIQYGHLSIVKLLVAEERVNINKQCMSYDEADNDVHGTPLSISLSLGYESIALQLLGRSDIDVSGEVHVEGNDGDERRKGTALFFATVMKSEILVRLLLAKNGIEINGRGYIDAEAEYDDSGYSGTPLFVAAAKNNETILRHLIATHGIDLNAPGFVRIYDEELESSGRDAIHQGTPLSIAASSGHMTIVGLLLTVQNVDVNARCYIKDLELTKLPQSRMTNCHDILAQGTPLFLANAHGTEEVVRLLLTRDDLNVECEGCMVNYPGYWGECGLGHLTYVGRSLPFAAWTGRKVIVEMLLAKNGVDVNTRAHIRFCPDTYHNEQDFEVYSQATSLLLAAAKEYEDIVMLLLNSRRAVVDAKDEHGRTPLMWAAYNSGCTPLFDAIRNGNLEMVKLLLENGADIYAGNTSGCTPVVHATRLRNWEIVGLLLEHAANDDMMNNSDSTPIICTIREDGEDMVDLVL
ncbi:ankyrin [Aspergillus niger ATCC 13496]|uniref:Ankyrin n=1 Tax=Aspergillus niger ATCC 13496 TaxID=1353008 RepID=A0A370C6Q0_ASPNG|nr:ankyrin [Aspergillus niger ATCC 13496]